MVKQASLLEKISSKYSMNRLLLHEKLFIKMMYFRLQFGCNSALEEHVTLTLAVGQLKTVCISIVILKHACYCCRLP